MAPILCCCRPAPPFARKPLAMSRRRCSRPAPRRRSGRSAIHGGSRRSAAVSSTDGCCLPAVARGWAGGRAAWPPRRAVGQIVVLAQGSARAAARVKALTSETALDGDTYVHAELQPPPTSLTG